MEMKEGGLDDFMNKMDIGDPDPSNHIDGFNVIVSSGNTGQLRHTAYNSGKAGTFVAYTLDIEDGPGTLGATVESILTGLDLASAQTLAFISPTVATVDKVYNFNITTTAKPSLLEGAFQDTLTITIANR